MSNNMQHVSLSDEAKAQLTPKGVLRAAINMGNFILVTGRTDSGDPDGVAPDMARAVAERLGVPVQFVPYPTPGELGDAVNDDVWDIALIGAEPQRAEKIEFTEAYSQIEATYVVPAGSSIESVDDVDRPGVRIAVPARTAYGLWLDRNIKQAELVHSDNENVLRVFMEGQLEVLAGLRPGLLSDVQKVPGGRVLDGHFATVQQAVGTAKANIAAAAFLREFVEEAKASGLVASLIEKHGVTGRLSVAPTGVQ